jgi:hypothetical protein
MPHYAVQSGPAKASETGLEAARTGMPLAGHTGVTAARPSNITLLFRDGLTHKHGMEQDPTPRGHPEKTPKDLLRWATTPPQSYAVYLVCLILVWMLSFYAGTLKPKKAEGLGPPPAMAPPR